MKFYCGCNDIFGYVCDVHRLTFQCESSRGPIDTGRVRLMYCEVERLRMRLTLHLRNEVEVVSTCNITTVGVAAKVPKDNTSMILYRRDCYSECYILNNSPIIDLSGPIWKFYIYNHRLWIFSRIWKSYALFYESLRALSTEGTAQTGL